MICMKTEDDRMTLQVLSSLNEAQARWYVAKEAISRGRGGIKELNRLTGMSRTTIIKGVKELHTKGSLGYKDRIRKSGGGRKRLEDKEPRLVTSLRKIIDEDTAGNPMNHLKWTSKSLQKIKDELIKQGYDISHETVMRRLREWGYMMQANKKNVSHGSYTHEKRDSQFRYINIMAAEFIKNGQPVISVDTKKKELVGSFRNSGKTWRKKGEPVEVNVHDFPNLEMGKAIPYGAYDVALNKGFVNVGVSSDTAEFAVESIKQWWKQLRKRSYKKADRLLICADSGDSNGVHNRGWKYFLQKLAKQTDLEITVLHFPPATSKWNKIEHKLFSFISMNWRGRPLITYEVIISLIAGTKTTKGLEVFARLDKNHYKRGLKFSDEEMENLKIKFHQTNPEWNYTILPP